MSEQTEPEAGVEDGVAEDGTPEEGGAQMHWVPVIALPEEIEATLAAGFLENQGIQCVVESRFFTQEPTNLSTLGEFVLYVHEDALERAKGLLEDRLEIKDGQEPQQNLDGLISEEE